MRRVPVAVLLVVLSASIAAPVSAQIVRWVDDAGVPHYGEGLDSVPERHRATATVVGLRRRAPEAEPTAGTTVSTSAPAGGATMSYTPGHRIIVDVRVNDTPARLLLDTGADHTVISPRVLAAAGVSLTRTVATGRVVGVTGTDQMSYVLVESLEIGSARIGRLRVGAYEMPSADADGLLGRDVLDRFKITIDAAQGLLTLAPK